MLSSLNDIPVLLQEVLLDLGYQKLAIDVEKTDQVSYISWSSSFLRVIDLINISHRNMDNYSGNIKMIPGLNIIKGFSCHKGLFATIFMPFDNIQIPNTKETLILSTFRDKKSSYDRKKFLEELKVSKAELQKLILQGYLKIDGRGITLSKRGKENVF